VSPIQIHGLAERAEQRRRDRLATRAGNLSRQRVRALRFLASLPTKTLVAVHKAAKQFHEQQNADTP
jgi:hypothetical protein